jgi:hypothetical protein
MALEYSENSIKSKGVINDNELVSLREFLQKSAPSKVMVDLTECYDIHTAIIQIFISYGALFEIEYTFADDNKSAYRKALDGARF